jgi:putative heme iron utilization protein
MGLAGIWLRRDLNGRTTQVVPGPEPIDRAARRLLRGCRVASLAVIADHRPLQALVTPAIAADGAPLLLLSTLAAHTNALAQHSACALLLVGPASDANPQTSPRLSLTGHARRSDDAADRARYLAIHPYARLYADFADFGLFRIEITEARFVGGFARAATLDPAHLRPDPAWLAGLRDQPPTLDLGLLDPGLLDQIAARHGHAQPGWSLAAIDPDGLDLAKDETVLRVEFDRKLSNPAELRQEIVRLAQGGDAAAHG